MGTLSRMWDSAGRELIVTLCWAQSRAQALARSTRGQGPTEYAILVGVLVVIAIIAIMVIRPKLQELWDAIAQGISGL